MKLLSRSILPSLVLSALCAGAGAQVPHGYDLVCWKPQNPTVPGGFRLVDRAGANTVVTGLDPATIGTTRFDGAQSCLVTGDGVAFAGLGADNRNGTTPLPLDLRKILLNGSNAVSDAAFATLMAVPAGKLWYVTDLKDRRDGSLLVATTEVLATSNPMPQTAAFVVSPLGAVTALPTTGFPAGSLLGIADAGDRFVCAFLQSFFVTNIEIWSFPYLASSPPAFRVFQFVNTSVFAGMDFDVNGELVLGVPVTGTSMVRMAHVANSTPVPVPNTPATAAVADVLPAAGLAAVFTRPGLVAGSLNVVDTLAGGFAVWANTVVLSPVDASVRQTPFAYGSPSPATGSRAWLGSFGGWPSRGNAGFGLRLGGAPSSAGVVLASIRRGNVPTPFGTLLLDPAVLLVLGTVSVPNSGTAQLPLPIPNDLALLRAQLDVQSAIVTPGPPVQIELSQGLEIVVL